VRTLERPAFLVYDVSNKKTAKWETIMCRIFAGQNPQTYAYETRSVRLSGHPTSVRLEARFWDIIEDIARAQNMTVGKFLSQLHDESLEIHGEPSNFASLLRCSCLVYLERGVGSREVEPMSAA
jgi:predicted DNA-binding ribbon-helix-helix protein